MSPGVTAPTFVGVENGELFPCNVMPHSWHSSSSCQLASPPRPAHHRLSRCAPQQGNLSLGRQGGRRTKGGLTDSWFPWQLKNLRDALVVDSISFCPVSLFRRYQYLFGDE